MISEKIFKTSLRQLGWLLIVSLLLTASSVADDEKSETPRPDLSGRWIVHMRNSLGVKTAKFIIEQEDDRPRGTIHIYGYEETRLNGRFDGENKVLLWGRHQNGRTGASTELEFKGTVEGELGDEVLRGKSEFFGKHYDFTARRAKD